MTVRESDAGLAGEIFDDFVRPPVGGATAVLVLGQGFGQESFSGADVPKRSFEGRATEAAAREPAARHDLGAQERPTVQIHGRPFSNGAAFN